MVLLVGPLAAWVGISSAKRTKREPQTLTTVVRAWDQRQQAGKIPFFSLQEPQAPLINTMMYKVPATSRQSKDTLAPTPPGTASSHWIQTGRGVLGWKQSLVPRPMSLSCMERRGMEVKMGHWKRLSGHWGRGGEVGVIQSVIGEKHVKGVPLWIPPESGPLFNFSIPGGNFYALCYCNSVPSITTKRNQTFVPLHVTATSS